MLDIGFIRQNPGALDSSLKNRNKPMIEQKLLALDEKNRFFITELQKNQEERNAISKEFGIKKSTGDDVSHLLIKIESLKEEMAVLEDASSKAKAEFMDLLCSIPNIPDQSCPIGVDESSNLEIRRFKEPRTFDFAPKEHYEIGENLGMIDFERSAKIAGSRFVFLFSDIAKLERCLAQFMLDTHTIENGYTEVYVPLILQKNAMFGVGQLPKFEEDLFKTTVDSYLIPTAEASLTNIYYNEIIDEKELPLRFTAYTPCFRSEAGSAGKDTKGMLRQHQFGKVELVSITTPDQSIFEHERMTESAESILKKLDLPFRTVALSTGDMGFSAQKTYDIEVFLPGQGKYREISSCSRCGDFQARRMNTRFKNEKTKKNEFVHTLNGSGIAVGRCLIAILENFQQKNGSIVIPSALVPYFGKEIIK